MMSLYPKNYANDPFDWFVTDTIQGATLKSYINYCQKNCQGKV